MVIISTLPFHVVLIHDYELIYCIFCFQALTEDHARLTEECQQLTQKVERGKARVRALESDAVKHKTQLKVRNTQYVFSS